MSLLHFSLNLFLISSENPVLPSSLTRRVPAAQIPHVIHFNLSLCAVTRKERLGAASDFAADWCVSRRPSSNIATNDLYPERTCEVICGQTCATGSIRSPNVLFLFIFLPDAFPPALIALSNCVLESRPFWLEPKENLLFTSICAIINQFANVRLKKVIN